MPIASPAPRADVYAHTRVSGTATFRGAPLGALQSPDGTRRVGLLGLPRPGNGNHGRKGGHEHGSRYGDAAHAELGSDRAPSAVRDICSACPLTSLLPDSFSCSKLGHSIVAPDIRG